MSKILQSLSIIFLGACILLGSWFISQSLKLNNDEQVTPKSEVKFRYEFISANEQNVVIFDKKTGEYWRKFIEPNSGPLEWEKQKSPVVSE